MQGRKVFGHSLDEVLTNVVGQGRHLGGVEPNDIAFVLSFVSSLDLGGWFFVRSEALTSTGEGLYVGVFSIVE